jgi:flavin reductase (DIM6/NTAB) family NADH-FMN oxidoreductase RutF
MIDVEPKALSVQTIQSYLQGGIGPRPIALVSTVSTEGQMNLSPFSYFNVFGANPPVVAFSPSRRTRDNTVKDTYNNLLATKECVIQCVTHAMVQQVSLASTEYPPGVNEFVKSGLTPVESDLVRPPRVQESPFQMECILKQMVSLGDGPGAGNLAICEVAKFHIDERLLTDGVMDPQKADLVARMGADYYCRAHGEAVFVVRKPVGRQGLGYDRLPEFIRKSDVLSANNLAQLANCERLPTAVEAEAYIRQLTDAAPYAEMYRRALAACADDRPKALHQMTHAAKCALESDDTEFAWHALVHAQILSK